MHDSNGTAKKIPNFFTGKKFGTVTTYSQRKVVLNERPVKVPESEDFKPSNPFKPLKPDYT